MIPLVGRLSGITHLDKPLSALEVAGALVEEIPSSVAYDFDDEVPDVPQPHVADSAGSGLAK